MLKRGQPEGLRRIGHAGEYPKIGAVMGRIQQPRLKSAASRANPARASFTSVGENACV